MADFFTILKKLSRNNATYLAHRALLRTLYGNKVQQLANRDMFNRPEWFWAACSIPPCKISRPDSTDGLDLDCKRALVRDLIRSFKAAQKLDEQNTSYSPLWRWNIERFAQNPVAALTGGDEEQLLNILEQMFTQPALWGIGYGDLGIYQGDRFATFVILYQLVGLAESLGVVRTECPEQGVLFHALRNGLEELVASIERELNLRIDFPKIGGSYGIDVGNRLLDMQTGGHLYAAYRLKANIDRYVQSNPLSVLEIGAGFGGCAYWFLKQAPASTRYLIWDLALTNVYQGWFLANALGRENVLLFADILDGVPVQSRSVTIMPTHSESSFGNARFDAVFNQDSFPEMTEEIVDNYLAFIHQRLEGILFSFNQEAYAPVKGVLPPWVAERVARNGKFKRVSRELCWVRRGYVEEIYKTT
jgi:hypothetical protein